MVNFCERFKSAKKEDREQMVQVRIEDSKLVRERE